MTTIIIRRADTIHFSGFNPPHTPHHEQQALHSPGTRIDRTVFHGNVYGYAHNASSDAGPITAYSRTMGPRHGENLSRSRADGAEHLSHNRDLTAPQTTSPYTLFSPAFAPPSSPTEDDIFPPMSTSTGRLNRGSTLRSQRFNPIAVPANRPTHRRRASRSSTYGESDDDDDRFQPGGSIATTDASRDSRCETFRIDSERDELREGSSIDRALSHIKHLETVKEQLEVRLKDADREVHRLRNINEALMLHCTDAANPASSAFSN